MKQEPKNEIDLLLRQFGRQNVERESASNGAGTVEGDHLDADEMNAFAEKTLPAAARARYVSHLADCSRCRQLVSQLSLASGVVIGEKPVAIPAASAIKSFLSSLFSPMVLRYAVPALALLIVAFIGLTMFRQSRQFEAAKHITNQEPQAVPSASGGPGITYSEQQPNEGRANSPQAVTGNPAKPKADASPRTEREEQPERKAIDDLKQAEAPPPPTDQVASAGATVAANEPVATPKSAVEKSKEERADETAAKGGKPNSIAQSDSVQISDNNKKAPAKEPAIASGGERMRVGAAKSKSEDTNTNQAKLMDAENERQRYKTDKDSTETRSVGGRQFRREGSVWIDVAYDASRRVINVSRDSEQYRALIADEPGIKTIADHLGGEVIVVWKSQAYRIR